jgi:hypothetical protein
LETGKQCKKHGLSNMGTPESHVFAVSLSSMFIKPIIFMTLCPGVVSAVAKRAAALAGFVFVVFLI